MLAWKILKGNVPTRVSLSRKGLSLPSLMCPLCNQADETIYHLFVECNIAYLVWSMVSRWMGLQGTYHNDLKHHLVQFYLP